MGGGGTAAGGSIGAAGPYPTIAAGTAGSGANNATNVRCLSLLRFSNRN